VREQLPNSPLVEVAFELRFPGAFEVYRALPDYQAFLGDEFPNLFVPRVSGGDAPALQPYRFASRDGTEMVSVAVNLFAYVSKTYTMFDAYFERLSYLMQGFFRPFRPRCFTRLGLRYVNSLPKQDGALRQLHPWLQFGVSSVKAFDETLDAFSAAFVVKYPEGNLLVRIGHASADPVAQEDATHHHLAGAFSLDMDFSRTGEEDVDSVRDFLTQGHRVIDQVFFELLTPAGRKAMEGA
jgi:uncharacterized protein (TIGR04255 family)